MLARQTLYRAPEERNKKKHCFRCLREPPFFTLLSHRVVTDTAETGRQQPLRGATRLAAHTQDQSLRQPGRSIGFERRRDAPTLPSPFSPANADRA